MTIQPSKKKIGAFVFTGLLLLFGAVALFFGDKFSDRDKHRYVLYFTGSVKGLGIGSNVVFKGVPIGKVEKIDFITNEEVKEFVIPVHIVVNSKMISPHYADKEIIKDQGAFIKKMIQNGLRGKVETQSLVTGQMMIELDMYPDAPMVLRSEKVQKGVVEIPTLPSTFEELSRWPLQEIVENLNGIAKTLNKETPEFMGEIKKITTQINKILDAIAGGSNSTSASDINKMVRDLSAAAQSVRDLTDYLERHPEALIKGKAGYN